VVEEEVVVEEAVFIRGVNTNEEEEREEEAVFVRDSIMEEQALGSLLYAADAGVCVGGLVVSHLSVRYAA